MVKESKYQSRVNRNLSQRQFNGWSVDAWLKKKNKHRLVP